MNTPLAEKLRSRKPCLGTWLSMGSPIIAELCASIGFDWLLLDLEHGCATEACVLPILQATHGRGADVIVRVGSADATLIARVLDWGAAGIMVPHLSTPEQAKACVAAMRYPPDGVRGYSRSVRAFGYGLRPPADVSKAEPPILLAQIEDREGVVHAEAIARVDGVDALFVGPSDLKLSLSVGTESGEDGFEEALSTVVETARGAGKSSGILIRNVDTLAETVQRGFSCVAVDSDLGVVRTGYCVIMQAIRGVFQ